MYVSYRPMVIHSCAKYGMTVLKDKKKKIAARTQSHVKNCKLIKSSIVTYQIIDKINKTRVNLQFAQECIEINLLI